MLLRLIPFVIDGFVFAVHVLMDFFPLQSFSCYSNHPFQLSSLLCCHPCSSRHVPRLGSGQEPHPEALRAIPHVDIEEGAATSSDLPLMAVPMKGKKSIKEFFQIARNVSQGDRDAIMAI